MRMQLSRCLSLAAWVALVSCGDLAGPKLLSLSRNRALWDSQNLHSYTYHQTSSCFCEFSGQTIAVRVEADTVASVSIVSTGQEIRKDFWLTIPGLFDYAAELLRAPDLSVKLEYEPSTGHPTFIGVSCPSNVLDCGGTRVIRLVPTPSG